MGKRVIYGKRIPKNAPKFVIETKSMKYITRARDREDAVLTFKKRHPKAKIISVRRVT